MDITDRPCTGPRCAHAGHHARDQLPARL